MTVSYEQKYGGDPNAEQLRDLWNLQIIAANGRLVPNTYAEMMDAKLWEFIPPGADLRKWPYTSVGLSLDDGAYVYELGIYNPAVKNEEIVGDEVVKGYSYRKFRFIDGTLEEGRYFEKFDRGMELRWEEVERTEVQDLLAYFEDTEWLPRPRQSLHNIIRTLGRMIRNKTKDKTEFGSSIYR